MSSRKHTPHGYIASIKEVLPHDLDDTNYGQHP